MRTQWTAVCKDRMTREIEIKGCRAGGFTREETGRRRRSVRAAGLRSDFDRYDNRAVVRLMAFDPGFARGATTMAFGHTAFHRANIQVGACGERKRGRQAAQQQHERGKSPTPHRHLSE